MTDNGVPEITIVGDRASSDSQVAPHVCDTCACWSKKSARAGRALLRQGRAVHCADATAHAAMISLSLSLLKRGVLVQSELIRDYEQKETECPKP